MSADILLYALVAAGLIFWLKSILGTEDEDEAEKRSKLFTDEDSKNELLAALKKTEPKNVVSLAALNSKGFDLPHHVRIDNKTTEIALEEISETHPSFDLYHFVDGAQNAFKMIIEAFADGDKDTLKNLLSDSVYKAFEQGIDERIARGEIVETQVKAVEKMDVTEALLKEGMLFMTVRFTAREICVIRDKDGQIISGHPDDTTQMVDVWVFGRDMSNGGPEWYLYETRDDEVEDHKTPFPEAGDKTPSKKAPKKK